MDIVLEFELGVDTDAGIVGVRLGSLGGVEAGSIWFAVGRVDGDCFANDPEPLEVLADRGRANVVSLGTGTAASCTSYTLSDVLAVDGDDDPLMLSGTTRGGKAGRRAVESGELAACVLPLPRARSFPLGLGVSETGCAPTVVVEAEVICRWLAMDKLAIRSRTDSAGAVADAWSFPSSLDVLFLFGNAGGPGEDLLKSETLLTRGVTRADLLMPGRVFVPSPDTAVKF